MFKYGQNGLGLISSNKLKIKKRSKEISSLLLTDYGVDVIPIVLTK
jgi:hypothetical protein